MSETQQYTFDTPEPTSLRVSIGSGGVDVAARPTDRTEVEVVGRDAEDTTVEQHGDHIEVRAPHRLTRGSDLHVRVTLPEGSDLVTKVGSADIRAAGRFGRVEASTGSGSVQVERADGDARVKTGSGDVEVAEVGGTADLHTGSGDIALGTVRGAVSGRSGSGRVRIADAGGDVNLRTGSGGIEIGTARRGSVQAKTGSGDVLVGIPDGTPVWTDVSTGSGRVESDLTPVGAPAEGQDHLELRASTGSGDVLLSRR